MDSALKDAPKRRIKDMRAAPSIPTLYSSTSTLFEISPGPSRGLPAFGPAIIRDTWEKCRSRMVDVALFIVVVYTFRIETSQTEAAAIGNPRKVYNPPVVLDKPELSPKRILKESKTRGGVKEFLIKWKGFRRLDDESENESFASRLKTSFCSGGGNIGALKQIKDLSAISVVGIILPNCQLTGQNGGQIDRIWGRPAESGRIGVKIHEEFNELQEGLRPSRKPLKAKYEN
ncbi:hypothetical protein B0H14DRAFT_2583665 [Mycena olivaceomarginata]|nr:hypothetical protein B0H14DRAFT_2583665 [Mycena olivaceomarginata]